MKREKLCDILRKAAVAAGYTFNSGPVHRMNGTIRVYPSAWLEPPVLRSAEGRREGSVTYRITLHLMGLPSATIDNEALWGRLEEDAFEVVGITGADDAVTEISNISCSPARQSLTAHGEVSVTLSCDVAMWYYI